MNDFEFMTSINVYYRPQDGQSFRCSDNFPNWNTYETGTLRFKVIPAPGYPMPIFAINHDKSGSDARWYTHVYDGKNIPINSGNGEGGQHAIYVGTTSGLPSGLDGGATYKVLVYQKAGGYFPAPFGYQLMTSVLAYYKPQNGQTFRCSANFPDWDTSERGCLKFEVTLPVNSYRSFAPIQPTQPTFDIYHDKTGHDTRWYSDLINGKEILVDSDNGSFGNYTLYIGTTSDTPDEFGALQYLVNVYLLTLDFKPATKVLDTNNGWYNRIGKLYFTVSNQPLAGSAAVVGNNQILTAAHNIDYDGRVSENVVFYPGRYTDRSGKVINPFGAFKMESYVLMPGYNSYKFSSAYDLAILTLGKNEKGEDVGKYGRLACRTKDIFQKYTCFGYCDRYDARKNMYMQESSISKNPGSNNAGQISKWGDMNYGASGGPWISFIDDIPYITGVQSSISRNGYEDISVYFGTEVAEFLKNNIV